MANKGGPAFPADQAWPDQGMSLRDYFAAAALTGLLAYGQKVEIAEEAYQYADMMIKERDK